jgi:hypothetical protein
MSERAMRAMLTRPTAKVNAPQVPQKVT